MTIKKLDPIGGIGGNEFTEYVVPEGTHLRGIRVYTADYVDALQLVYETASGDSEELPKVGGLGGTPHNFVLEPDEYLTGISGTHGWYINNIRFHTNKRTSDPFGGSDGDHEFRQDVPAGSQVVGFCGRNDWFVDAIGLIIRELPAKAAPKAKPAKAAPKKAAPKKSSKTKTVKAPAPKKVSPTPPSKTPQSRKPNLKDLKKIEGIGPKIAEMLVDNGIVDLHDLANTKVETLQKILDAAGARYRMADPDTWPEQAALGARGDWQELKKFQATLDRGRRVS